MRSGGQIRDVAAYERFTGRVRELTAHSLGGGVTVSWGFFPRSDFYDPIDRRSVFQTFSADDVSPTIRVILKYINVHNKRSNDCIPSVRGRRVNLQIFLVDNLQYNIDVWGAGGRSRPRGPGSSRTRGQYNWAAENTSRAQAHHIS